MAGLEPATSVTKPRPHEEKGLVEITALYPSELRDQRSGSYTKRQTIRFAREIVKLHSAHLVHILWKNWAL